MFGLYMLAIYLGVAVIGAGIVALPVVALAVGLCHASHPHARPRVPQARRPGHRPGTDPRFDCLVLDRSLQAGLRSVLLGGSIGVIVGSIIIRALAEWVLERPTRAERCVMMQSSISTFDSRL